MRERCRVTEELNAYMRLVDKAEQQQAQIDALADDYMSEVMGYRDGHDISSFTDSLIDLKDKRFDHTRLAEVFGEYLARKFARIEPGITDDRQVQADEYLRERIKEWADAQAETTYQEGK